jgi:hypothetical protein
MFQNIITTSVPFKVKLTLALITILTISVSLIYVSYSIQGTKAEEVQAQSLREKQCFEETGYCIEGRIGEFWQQNGGLPVFGYPKGPQETIIIEENRYVAQNFERNRLELHPENRPPYDVLLGRLGDELLLQNGINWQTEYPDEVDLYDHDCLYFEETEKNVCGNFKRFFLSHGLTIYSDSNPYPYGYSLEQSIALFGLPISPEIEATIQRSPGEEPWKGKVQWFERARFEWHPENPENYKVLLGLLGNEKQGQGGLLVDPINPDNGKHPAWGNSGEWETKAQNFTEKDNCLDYTIGDLMEYQFKTGRMNLPPEDCINSLISITDFFDEESIISENEGLASPIYGDLDSQLGYVSYIVAEENNDGTLTIENRRVIESFDFGVNWQSAPEFPKMVGLENGFRVDHVYLVEPNFRENLFNRHNLIETTDFVIFDNNEYTVLRRTGEGWSIIGSGKNNL